MAPEGELQLHERVQEVLVANYGGQNLLIGALKVGVPNLGAQPVEIVALARNNKGVKLGFAVRICEENPVELVG